MRLPVIRGLIRRRLLVNFRVEPDVIARLLPAPFRPKLHRGYAIAGICLIRLEQIRPAGLPAAVGISSENAAHRIAVTWTDVHGAEHEGVYIPRRDTGSRLNHLAGGRVFPGEHHLAKFEVTDDGRRISLTMQSRENDLAVHVAGAVTRQWPAHSCFDSVADSSAFFRAGSLGFSATSDPCRLDGLLLKIDKWQVNAFEVSEVASTYFDDPRLFPPSSIIFDHALIMRDIPHEWHQAEDMVCASA